MIGSQFAMAGIFTQKFSKLFNKQNQSDSVAALFLGTLCGGYVSGFWCGPIELAMIQQQRFGMTLGNCVKKIIGEFGLTKGVFRGTFNTSMREGIFSFFLFLILAIFCFSYLGLIPTFTPMIEKRSNLNNATSMLLASFAASTVAIIFSHPFDTIKTNLQGDLGIFN
jgi:hypothetical protein